MEDELSELREATERYQALLKELEEARAVQRALMKRAVSSGARQVDVVRVTGYNREHVRRILLDD